MTGVVLITGASGYAGGGIAAALRTAGVDVVTAGRRPQDMVKFDLELTAQIRRCTLPPGMTACVHVAAWNEVGCAADPVAAYSVNVTATRALVAAALEAGIRRFVYVSTFHVFGRFEGLLDETSIATPSNDYGLTHRLAEEIFFMVGRQSGCTINILRSANLYGLPTNWCSFSRWTLAPFDFVRQAVQKGEIVLHSDGSPVRSYVSLDHLGAAAAAALQGEVPPGVTHVAGRAWSMAALASLTADVVARDTGIAVPVRLGDHHPSETSYLFDSRIWPVDADVDGAKMQAFLTEVARHIRAAGAAHND